MKLHPIVRWLLWPLSLVYGAAVMARAWLYRIGVFRQKRLDAVVISVGNLTVGGTGKTPLVMMLAQQLSDEGKNVGILSRGYKGRPRMDEGKAGDSATRHSALSSDETAMMQRHLAGKARIGVGADRYRHARWLQEDGVEWFLLDDGFQHLRLARDADILLIDAKDPFGDGKLLPAGRLREPKSAIARADLIVITRSDHAPAVEAIVRHYTKAPLFYAQPELKEIYLEGRGSADARTAEWLGKRVFVFCGIGNPQAFVENASQWGMDVAGHMEFPDHHRYTGKDASEIERRAEAAGAQALLCTEKDSYNLSAVQFTRLPLFVCRIGMRVNNAEIFWEALDSIIERKRAGRAR